MMHLPRRPRVGPLTLFAFLALAPTAHPQASGAVERMRADLTFLAGDECEGRGPETAGINKAADFIVRSLKDAGLRPGLPDGTYFQKFTIPGTPRLGTPNSLVLHGPSDQTVELKAGEQFAVSGLGAKGKADAEVVFAGFGLTVPGGKGEKPTYDDYAGLDVKGKVVLVLRKAPRFGKKDGLPGVSQREASLAYKVENAEQHKAAAILFVNDAGTAAKTDDLMAFDYAAGSPRAEVPVLHVRRAVVDQMLQGTGKTLADLEGEIERDLKPSSRELTGWKAQIQTTVERVDVPVKNIVGVLEGKGPLADETVVIGAHYDHLGRGDPGSLAVGDKAIHHGADDNGSGTTSVLELARRFGARKDRVGRRLVFILFTGEERGLLGSAYYCKNPVFPLKNTVAMVNLDMVGRVRADDKTHKDKLEVGGVGTAKTFEALIERLNQSASFELRKTRSGFGPSDHASFYRKEIPVFFLFSGMHPDYHRPSDTADKVNYAGMEKVVGLTDALLADLSTEKERPVYQKTGAEMSMSSRTGGPRLGFMPGEYNEDETRGVPVGGVSPNGAAAKAGIREGDWIVEVAGTPVKNMGGYMRAMANQKVGQTIEVIVVREGKRVPLKVTPQ